MRECDWTQMDYVLIACLLLEFAEIVFGWISHYRRCRG